MKHILRFTCARPATAAVLVTAASNNNNNSSTNNTNGTQSVVASASTCCSSSSSALQTSWRGFVDAPVAADPVSDPLHGAAAIGGTGLDTSAGSSSGATAGFADAAYVYPLDSATQKIQVYGESSAFAVDDSNRVISSNRLHSYDPGVLSAELRLQDSWGPVPEEQADAHAGAATGAKDGLNENEAVMREGRNKQGAAGAAAVAAAMLESRRAVDGIALVPGHPLPVVFPRPDDSPPPLRFIKKFGPGAGRQTTSKGRARSRSQMGGADQEDANDEGIYSEVMESDSHLEAHSFQKSFVFHVRVLDEKSRPAMVKGFHHFSELAESLPDLVQRGLVNANFTTPTLMQSAVIPVLLMNKDLVCVAPRTSGRTYAIAIRALTVLMKVMASGSATPLTATATSTGHASPVALVVCATTEMARRMSSAFHVLAGEEVTIETIYMGKDDEKQNEALRTGACQVLLATPKRLAAAVSAGLVLLDNVHFAAAFDADVILEDDTTSAALTSVMQGVRSNHVPHQLSLWCSAITNGVEHFASHCLQISNTNTVVVSKEEKMNANVRQVLYALKSKEDRLDCIWKLYDSHAILKREQVVIFCLFKETAEMVAKTLLKLLEAPSSLIQFLHSGVRASKREQIVQNFIRGNSRILVTTDAAAKKLDVPDLEHIIHYDLAPTTELLARRTRHVGRSGRPATVHTFLCPEDSAVPLTARFIAEQTGKALSPEIEDIVRRIEETGVGDTWSTPVIRFSDHIGLSTRWRVRGQLDDPSNNSPNGNNTAPEGHGRSSSSGVKRGGRNRKRPCSVVSR